MPTDQIAPRIDENGEPVCSESRQCPAYRYIGCGIGGCSLGGCAHGPCVPALRRQRDEAREDLDAARHAARLPTDYEHGLPAWINRLYLGYIGGQLSPEAMDAIANGRLTFPESPVYRERDELQLDRYRLQRELEEIDDLVEAAKLVAACYYCGDDDGPERLRTAMGDLSVLLDTEAPHAD